MSSLEMSEQSHGKNSDALKGGFTDAVKGAQSVFHSVMSAMSRPGMVLDIDTAVKSPKPLNPVSAALLLTLCDVDTPVWLDAELARSGAVSAWLNFHTGARVTDDKQTAAFAVIGSLENPSLLGEFSTGSQEYPDRSTTIIAQVNGFTSEPEWILFGPGIRKSTGFQPDDLGHAFIDCWSNNHALFPRGVDMIFASLTQLAALPRSTQISLKGEA